MKKEITRTLTKTTVTTEIDHEENARENFYRLNLMGCRVEPPFTD